MKVTAIGHIGDNDTAKEFIQLVRAFDIAHPGECMFRISIDAPTATVDEMENVLNVDPPFAYRQTIRKL
jgi:hypothetical protein